MNSIGFQQSFIAAVRNHSKQHNSVFPSLFISTEFPNEAAHYPHYISLLAGGNVTASYPHSYDAEQLDSYCILYTEDGSGYLRYEARTFYLDPNSLVFFDCHKVHHLELQHAPWKYKILFLKGSPLTHYFDQFSLYQDVICFVTKNSCLPQLLDTLLTANTSQAFSTLLQNRRLHDLFTELIIEKQHGNLPMTEVRNHVVEMKYLFESHCEFHYTLSWLEEHFKISRFRLCREFKVAEGTSPIAYLNTVRINKAKYLLLSSKMRIHEIAAAVGIENTNHFINLFRVHTGTTPSKYRC